MPNYIADDVSFIKQKMDELERERINSIQRQPEDEPPLTMEEAEAPPIEDLSLGCYVGSLQGLNHSIYYFTDAAGKQWMSDGTGNIVPVST